MPLTITEALAEIKTIDKRIDKKQEFVLAYLSRQEGLKDPLEKDGGSVQAIARELQSITDLQKRIVVLRHGIQVANEETEITINGVTYSIANWLTWRRDVAPKVQQLMSTMRSRLNQLRDQARRAGGSVVQPAQPDAKPQDYVVNIDEGAFAKDSEVMEEILGALDGQLSLKNATVLIKEG